MPKYEVTAIGTQWKGIVQADSPTAAKSAHWRMLVSVNADDDGVTFTDLRVRKAEQPASSDDDNAA